MDGNQWRQFKHELRTPLNHILGYGGLIHELAAEEGDTAMAGMAQQLSATAKQVSLGLEHALMIAPTESRDVAAMRGSAAPLLNDLRQNVLQMLQSSAAGIYMQDVHKIQAALNRLDDILDHLSVSA